MTTPIVTSRRLLFALLALVGGLAPACADATTVGAEPVAFHVEEMLFHPTTDGVSLVLVPAEDATLLVEYGQGGAMRQTPEQRVVAEGTADFRLDGLDPGERCDYRVGVRRGTSGELAWRPGRSFRTLPEPGSPLSFAILADSHAWAQWARMECGDHELGWNTLRHSLDSVAADAELSFALIGTDSAMTRCRKGCVACPVDGEPTAEASAASARDALLRYRKVYGPSIYGRIGARLPLLTMLGDHDGERGWTVERGACRNTADWQTWSRAARTAHIPDSYTVYAGDPDGSYYAVRAGDLLLVLIDGSHYTSEAPTTAEVWSLGEAQWSWLETTLASSDATFKMVLTEHMLGGLRSPGGRGSWCWKARSSLRATVTGETTAPFVGEQQRLHELMRDRGVQLFVSFHDHIVAMGEKPGIDGVSEGVAYLVGGQCADAASEDVGVPGPPWAHEKWYQEAMDFDGDGVPEYLTDRTGTLEKGWFKVTVHGAERVDLDYLRSSADPALNGRRVVGLQLFPDGPLLPAPR